jgi:predicted DNA-binding transcriptional regulator AlpA
MNQKQETWPRATGPGYKTGPQKPVPVPSDAKFISMKQVCARYGNRSPMWVERKLDKDPKFPKPKKIGRMRFWEVSELETYERGI